MSLPASTKHCNLHLNMHGTPETAFTATPPSDAWSCYIEPFDTEIGQDGSALASNTGERAGDFDWYVVVAATVLSLKALLYSRFARANNFLPSASPSCHHSTSPPQQTSCSLTLARSSTLTVKPATSNTLSTIHLLTTMVIVSNDSCLYCVWW